jgi:xanthine dehydrogenase YagR molybdenum-binding subunit
VTTNLERSAAAQTTLDVRPDGPVKVTGAARYAADHAVAGMTHAALVTATVPAGRIRTLHTGAALAVPGVRAVLDHHNAPRLGPPAGAPYGGPLPLQDSTIHYEGQPMAVVVADDLAAAREAASLVTADIDPAPATLTVDGADGYVPSPPPRWGPADTSVGDVADGLDRADVVVRSTYRTSARHHVPIEPSATLAQWDGTRLVLHDATQGVFNVRAVLSSALGLDPEQVRVIAKYTGGGFGSKGYVWPHQLLAAMAAMATGGAVRLVLTRAQTFASHGYQPPTRQEVTLGAHRDGRLTALRHTSVNPTATYGEYPEMAASASRATYACPAIETTHRVVPVNTVLPTPMRAPHEGTGMFAIESAMDELAHRLDVDPLELRIRNHADHDPTTGLPFSSKQLLACYRQGADRFGWAGRPRAPRSIRDGDELVGHGMSTAVMTTIRFPATARVRLAIDGSITVEAGTQEIGTGTYTIMPTLVAEVLGCDPARVRLSLGDTTLPVTGMTAGSSTTLSVGSAVRDAAERLREQLAGLARDMADGPVDDVTLDGADLVLAGSPVGRLPVAAVLGAHRRHELVADGSWAPTDNERSMHSFGAVFAEVAVDALVCTVRVRRIVGVYSAGRVINPVTARSQLTGGMVWGIGQALLERSELDTQHGRFVTKNLSGYRIPSSADVPELVAEFVPEYDEHASAIGARGIGELAAVGVSAAIANAVWHATGVRVRELPVTPEALLDATGARA